MTYPTELQEYYDAHDAMMAEERRSSRPSIWGWAYGNYKVARANAVKAGYLPGTPEFG